MKKATVTAAAMAVPPAFFSMLLGHLILRQGTIFAVLGVCLYLWIGERKKGGREKDSV